MNAEEFRALYMRRAADLEPALRKAMGMALLAVETNTVKNFLSGSGGAGSYPIPVRSRKERGKSVPGGNLRRSMDTRVESGGVGYVFNKAKYARANHKGFQPYGNPHAMAIPPRPFLRDGLKGVRINDIFRRTMQREILLAQPQ